MSEAGNIYSATSNAGALKMVDLWGHFVLNGYAFTHKDNYVFSTGQTRKFLLTPICPTGGVPGFTPVVSADKGPILINYYVNPTGVTGGTSCLVYNRNAVAVNPASSTVTCDVTTVTNGTKFSADLIPASGAGGAHASSGASSSFQSPFNFSCSSTYLMEVTNTNGDSTTVNIEFNFAEV